MSSIPALLLEAVILGATFVAPTFSHIKVPIVPKTQVAQVTVVRLPRVDVPHLACVTLLIAT
jgi:hypothetical protein